MLIMDRIKQTCCCWSLKRLRKDKWPVTSLNWCVCWIFSSSKVSWYIFSGTCNPFEKCFIFQLDDFFVKKANLTFLQAISITSKGGPPNTLTATVLTVRRSQHLSQTLRKGTTSGNTTGQAWRASPSWPTKRMEVCSNWAIGHPVHLSYLFVSKNTRFLEVE